MGLLTHDLPLVLLVLIGFTLPLTLFPDLSSPVTNFVGTILLAVWDFSKLFVLFVALLVAVLGSEAAYRRYLRWAGEPEPAEFTEATEHGIEREREEDVRTRKFEAFARQSGLHAVVKGVFRAVTAGRNKGLAPAEAVTGHSSQTARGATPPPAVVTSKNKSKSKAKAGAEDEIEMRPITPRREGLRQRPARTESPAGR